MLFGGELWCPQYFFLWITFPVTSRSAKWVKFPRTRQEPQQSQKWKRTTRDKTGGCHRTDFYSMFFWFFVWDVERHTFMAGVPHIKKNVIDVFVLVTILGCVKANYQQYQVQGPNLNRKRNHLSQNKGIWNAFKSIRKVSQFWNLFLLLIWTMTLL